MSKLYMDKTTGELLTKQEALTIWREEYDGDDPTNAVPFEEQFERMEVIV